MVFNFITVSDIDSVNEDWLVEHPVVLAMMSVCTLVILVMVLIQCGGCTEMEVGTDSHPASGGAGKSTYSGIVGDANTTVMHSAHTMPGDSHYDPNAGSPGLPYSMNPVGTTVQGFTGYQPVGGYQGDNIAGYQPGGFQTQSVGGYQAPVQPNAPAIHTTGYQVQNQASAPQLGPHAHRPAVEPAPPSYNESMRSGHGWVSR